MSQGNCNEPDDWRDSPFITVIYDYTVKNAGMPSDMGTLIAYVLLFVATWYVFVWTARFLLSLVWPVIIVLSALFLFRFLRNYRHEDLLELFLEFITLISETLLSLVSKALDYLTYILD